MLDQTDWLFKQTTGNVACYINEVTSEGRLAAKTRERHFSTNRVPTSCIPGKTYTVRLLHSRVCIVRKAWHAKAW